MLESCTFRPRLSAQRCSAATLSSATTPKPLQLSSYLAQSSELATASKSDENSLYRSLKAHSQSYEALNAIRKQRQHDDGYLGFRDVINHGRQKKL